MRLISLCAAFVRATFRSAVRDERGASLVEYALLTVLIAVVCVTAVSMVGATTATSFSRSASSIQ